MGLKLNKAQEEAASHFEGPMMVLAGPGSGKTTVIAHRVKNLIDVYGVNPKDILVITFSKSAAIEMSGRFSALCPGVDAVMFATFHSYFFRIIRRRTGISPGSTLDDIAAREMLARAIRETSAAEDEDEDFLRDIRNEISLVKNEILNIDFYNSINTGSKKFRDIYLAYERLKEQAGVIDFDDMLVKCYELLISDKNELEYWRNRHKFILIDEFQDINRVQYECVRLLSQNHNNLFIVGDDDQSIFKFRGANPEFLLSFPNDYAGTKRVVLDVNYRSSMRIINLCGEIISRNNIRYDKKIHGTSKQGGALMIIRSKDISNEAARIAGMIKNKPPDKSYEDYAVVYRTNIQARAFVDAFIDLNIPFQVKDGVPSIYDHWIAKDTRAYMKLALNRGLDDELARIINRPKRYISKDVLRLARKKKHGLLNALFAPGVLKPWQTAKIEELIYHLNEISRRNAFDAIKYIRKGAAYDSYLTDYSEYRKINPSGLFEVMDEITESAKGFGITDYLCHVEESGTQRKKENTGEGVTLSTMHSVKGLEYDTVFVAGVVEGVVPHERSKLGSEIEEERRLLYVAMSRAKSNLYISVTRSRYDNETKLSSFFNGITKEN